MFLPKLEALLSVRLCITLAPKKLHLRRKSWARFFTDRPLCFPGWSDTKTQRRQTVRWQSVRRTAQANQQLLPWWLCAPRQSPTTRWRTPRWHSSSAAPSAPERRWWSYLEREDTSSFMSTSRDSYSLEQQEQLVSVALVVSVALQPTHTQSRCLGPGLQQRWRWAEAASWCCWDPHCRCPAPCWSRPPGQTAPGGLSGNMKKTLYSIPGSVWSTLLLRKRRTCARCKNDVCLFREDTKWRAMGSFLAARHSGRFSREEASQCSQCLAKLRISANRLRNNIRTDQLPVSSLMDLLLWISVNENVACVSAVKTVTTAASWLMGMKSRTPPQTQPSALMLPLYVSANHGHHETFKLYISVWCCDSAVQVWLGLDTKTTWLGSGRDHVLV